jgi:hypothetical protein
MHDIYFVAPMCQKLYSSCPHILISKSLEDLKEANFNHFIVLTGWLLQGGRGKAAPGPGFLVDKENERGHVVHGDLSNL